MRVPVSVCGCVLAALAMRALVRESPSDSSRSANDLIENDRVCNLVQNELPGLLEKVTRDYSPKAAGANA
jgi:hypothetical protein